MIRRLARLAEKLDRKRMTKDADFLDSLIIKIADELDDPFDDLNMPHDEDDEDGEDEGDESNSRDWEEEMDDESFEDQFQKAWEEEGEEDITFKRMTGVKSHTFRGMMSLMYKLAAGEVINLQSAQEIAKRILDEEGLNYEDINPQPVAQSYEEPEESLGENVHKLFPKK
jgi:hypothetical protein